MNLKLIPFLSLLCFMFLLNKVNNSKKIEKGGGDAFIGKEGASNLGKNLAEKTTESTFAILLPRHETNSLTHSSYVALARLSL